MAERCSPAWRALLGFRCALFMIPWLMHLLLADLALSALLPLSAVFPNACYNTSSRIAESVWRNIQAIFIVINGATITMSGAEKLPIGESAIVVSNHVEWTDFYMIQEVATNCGMLSRCRWFAKQQLKWVPFLGWGLWAMGMPLVSRRWMTDQREIDRVFKGVLQRRWPMCEWHMLRRGRSLNLTDFACFQGSSPIAKQHATPVPSDSKLRHGVESMASSWENMCCTPEREASSRVCRSYARRLTSKPCTISPSRMVTRTAAYSSSLHLSPSLLCSQT